MEQEKNKKAMRDRILEAIETGKVSMRPKWHFVLKTALMVTGGIIALLALLYLGSLVLFVLRRTGVWFVPIFGSRGWFEFFKSLPWLLILASLVFVVVLEILVRHYKFAYRRPLLFSVAGIILILAAGVFVVDRARLHDRFSRYTEQNHLPFARDFYHGFRSQKFMNVHGGKVTTSTQDGFWMQNIAGDELRVIVASSTRFPLGMGFSVGDAVVVFGPEASGTIQAMGIRKVDEDFDAPRFGFPPRASDFKGEAR